MTKRPRATTMAGVFALASGVIFAVSLAWCVFAYVVMWGPTPIPWSWPEAAPPVLWDAALFSAFALHHSVLARTGAKRLVTRVVPDSLERSSYVLVASLLFIAVLWWWRPVPGLLWHVDGATAAGFRGLQIAGILVTARAAAQLDVLDLAGLRGLWPRSRGDVRLVDRGLYGVVRHPVYLGWILMFWPTPAMSGTRLVFCLVSTAYLAAAVPFEERDLERTWGEAYRAYASRVRWRIVPFVY